MAREPIDVSSWPSMVSVQCSRPVCDEWVAVIPEHANTARCGIHIAEDVGLTTNLNPEKPAHWFTANNPPPEPPVYPPSEHEGVTVRVENPDLTARCLDHRLDDPAGQIILYSLDPLDVTVAFGAHDHRHHNPTAWYIGGAGGADADICNPCGGGSKDKTPLPDGPRHDLCLRGNPRGGWGRNCPCTHDKPYMRGTKPGDRDIPGAVDRYRADLAARQPEPAPPPAPTIIANYLWDPEEEIDTDD